MHSHLFVVYLEVFNSLFIIIQTLLKEKFKTTNTMIYLYICKEQCTMNILQYAGVHPVRTRK